MGMLPIAAVEETWVPFMNYTCDGQAVAPARTHNKLELAGDADINITDAGQPWRDWEERLHSDADATFASK
jgi:hypothetical protein